VRVPHRRRRHDLVPRGEHPPAGRAPRLRRGHRHRPRARAVPPRRGRPARLRRPEPLGHSIEFRINGEDPGRGFLPQPGRIHQFKTFGGPGIRLDSGVTAGDSVSGAFDSLLGKLIVTGRDRAEALERSRRALDEFEVSGMPTVLPFHRKVVRDPAFTAEDGHFGVFTRWIETEFVNDIPPWDGEPKRRPRPSRATPSSSRSPASASR
jgi:acetyl/propionyl-CoA carboxylase alpha subunit